MRLFQLGAAVALMGCQGTNDGGSAAPTDTSASTGTTPSTPTETTPTSTTTTTTTTTTTIPPDCSGSAISWREMVMEPSEDFTIGSDGMLYGVSTGNDALIRSDYDGAFEILAPNVSTWGRGTRFLPGGDLVVVVPDTGTVQRFDPATWGSVAIATGLSEPNGIAIGDDGMVYLTQLNGLVLRIDPDTLEVREIEPAGDSTDGITFGPDYRTLYWNHEAGEVIRAVLDDDGYVIDGPYLHADLTDFGSGRLDGMTSDACGNLYVVRMAGQIVRVFPNGSAEIFADLSATGNPFICAVNFGSGSGGFVETNLYVMDLTGGMFEIETDIPPNPEPHL